jgi:hypothetical protein
MHGIIYEQRKMMKKNSIVLFLFIGFQFGIEAVIKIVPVTSGEDSIVDAIKTYSDLRQSDVNKYKIRLGDIGTSMAFMLGAYGSIMASRQAHSLLTNYGTGIQNVLATEVKGYGLSQGTQNFLQSPYTWTLGSFFGSGWQGYRILYPRTRRGILEKVQQFIEVCQSLEKSPTNIITTKFSNVGDLRGSLPEGWKLESDESIYNALENLAGQANSANSLLNNILTGYGWLNAAGDIVDIQHKQKLVEKYGEVLLHNTSQMAHIIEPIRLQRAQLGKLEADTKMKNVATVTMYGAIAKGTVSSIWNGIKELYAHPEILALLGLGWVTTKYLAPSMVGIPK